MENREKSYKTKGQRVKEVRRAAGLSRDELAEILGYSRGLVDAIEQGHRNLTLENAEKIAAACNVLEDYLLLKTDFKTHAEAIRDNIHKLQNDDVMWMAFIKHITLYAGYEFKEADRDGISSVDVNAPYIVFKRPEAEKWLSLRETNYFIDDIERYAEMRLKTIFDRKEHG